MSEDAERAPRQPPAGRRWLPRFSLRSMLLFNLLVVGILGVGFRRAPWVCRVVFQGHEDSVWCAAFSPDSARIVTGGHDKNVRLWDASTGKCLRVLRVHDAHVTHVVYSPDGEMFASSDTDDWTLVWSADGGKVLQRLKGGGASFHPHGKRIATGTKGGTVSIWDIETGRRVAELRGHADGVTDTVFSSDGALLVTASDDGDARLWNTDSGERIKVMKGLTKHMRSIALSPDGSLVVTAGFKGYERKGVTAVGKDEVIQVWDLETSSCVAELHGHDKRVWNVSFSPNGGRIVSAGRYDNTTRLWDSRTFECVAVIPHDHAVNDARLSSDGLQLLVASSDKTAKVWSRRRPEAWWGIAWLWEFWVAIFLGALLLLSLCRDRKYFKSLAAKQAGPESPASPSPSE